MLLAHPSPIAAVPLRASHAARPWLCVGLLGLSDMTALGVSAAISLLGWSHFTDVLSLGFYLRLWPVLLLFPAAYAVAGLYPGFGRSPVDELRKLSATTSTVYAALAVTVFLLKDAPAYSRPVFVLAWAQTLALAPLLRGWVRWVCARKSWWGFPVAIVAEGRIAQRIVETLEEQPQLGLKAVAVFDDPERAVRLLRDRPENGPLGWLDSDGEGCPRGLSGRAQRARIRHVILDMAEMPRHVALSFFNHCSDLFPNVIVVPDLAGFSSLWVEARDLSGVLGLEVHQRLLLPGARMIKRALDLVFVILGGLVVLPFMVLIAAAIKLTSSGPVFYGQRRLGRGGEDFTAWKFRSMVANASQVLEQHLKANPKLRQEWLQTQKLRRDPRITPVGRFLRRTSMDELPQLWNILRGEMSLVGPRPIVTEEIARYGGNFALYKKVRPGMTGMWQVSGRNLLTYEQRIGHDAYYIRNWSPWLDLYILARTVTAVLLARGAY